MPTPPPTTRKSIRVTKQFLYRGAQKRWSNRYYMTGAVPTTSSMWTDLCDAVVAEEAPMFESTVTIVECMGFDAGSDVPVFTKAFTQAGTGTFASAVQVPGDCAAVLRHATDARTSKNHPIYLFSYFHGVFADASVSIDTLDAAQKVALEEYGTDWITGIVYSGGAHTVNRCGPYGAVAQDRLVLPEVRHRDFV